MELHELIAELAKHDKAQVADALKEHASEHYQAVYQRGFSTSHGEASTRIAAKEAEIQTLKEAAEAQASKIKELQDRTPDAEEVTRQYEERLQSVQREKDEAIAEANRRVTELHKTRFKSDLKAALIAAEIDPDYASEVLVNKYDSRIKVSEDGSVKVMDDDGLTPLQAANGELASLFAKRIKAGVDPKWITSKVDRGAGASGGQGVQATSTEWDKLREAARQRQAASTQSDAAKQKLAAL